MELIVGRPVGSPVVRDYVAGEASTRPFFPRAFTSKEDFEAKAAEVDGRFDRAARERAVEALIVPPGSRAGQKAWICIDRHQPAADLTGVKAG